MSKIKENDIYSVESELPKYRKVKDIGLKNDSLSGLFIGSLKDKIKGFFLFFKYAYQRIKYGISEYDAFNLYYALQLHMENGLKMLLNGCMGHPYSMKEQEWGNYLKELIDKLEYINSDPCEGPYILFLELKEKYGESNERTKKAFQDWIDYEREFDSKQQEYIKQVLEDLKPQWGNLWD